MNKTKFHAATNKTDAYKYIIIHKYQQILVISKLKYTYYYTLNSTDLQPDFMRSISADAFFFAYNSEIQSYTLQFITSLAY